MLLNSFFQVIKEESRNGVLAVTVGFNPGHEIYKAHFPGQPITPGVCQIQMVTELLSRHLGKELQLASIKNVKYMSVISPDEVTELEVCFLSIILDNGTCKVDVAFKRDERLFTKMSMTYKCGA